ncbi:MAG: heme-copper oxidase subunit III [Myxococcota bacterium]|nr:heme-copper oxidase subunit III [Myxococcota bacterium]
MSEAALPTPPPQVDDGRRINRGRSGMFCLILTESAFFAIFVVGYLFYIGKSLSGPYPVDVLDFPIIGTVALLSSSATIVLAVRDLRRGHIALFAASFFITIALGITFVVMTALEWQRLIYEAGLTISTNLFGTTFYSLVGFHALHVCVGVLIMSGILILTVLGHVREDHAENVELVSWYWHFVDAVWIVVLTTVYIIGV